MIDEVAATRELVLMLVEVELVMVPLVELIDARSMFPALRLVIVALVKVAFEEVKKEVEAVSKLATSALVVVELVVEEFEV